MALKSLRILRRGPGAISLIRKPGSSKMQAIAMAVSGKSDIPIAKIITGIVAMSAEPVSQLPLPMTATS